MDMNELIATLNRGGWKVDGFWNGKDWEKLPLAGSETVTKAEYLSDILNLHLSGGTAKAVKCKGHFCFECDGDSDNPHRIVVKGPTSDGSMKAKFLLVNPTALEENKRRSREAKAAKKAAMRKQIDEFLAMFKGEVLEEIEIVDGDRVTLRFKSSQSLDILAVNAPGDRANLYLDDHNLADIIEAPSEG